jgi:hypothetical protein
VAASYSTATLGQTVVTKALFCFVPRRFIEKFNELIKKDYTKIPNPYKFGKGEPQVERRRHLTRS